MLGRDSEDKFDPDLCKNFDMTKEVTLVSRTLGSVVPLAMFVFIRDVCLFFTTHRQTDHWILFFPNSPAPSPPPPELHKRLPSLIFNPSAFLKPESVLISNNVLLLRNVVFLIFLLLTFIPYNHSWFFRPRPHTVLRFLWNCVVKASSKLVVVVQAVVQEVPPLKAPP